jgi:hypothetical protein
MTSDRPGSGVRQLHRLPDFLLLIEGLGRSGAFWLYAGIGLLTLAFCWKFVPETKGMRLEDIQGYFQARADRRRTST